MALLAPCEYGLPQSWLPDETLFSLCSRYHAISGNRLASTTCRLLFGHKTQGCAHDFPARIEHFLTAAGPALGRAADIVEDRTVLPFYLRFANPDFAERVVLASQQASSGALKFQLGLLTSRFRANHPLKACHLCMSEDAREHLTAYWHRTHQLPGVWVCQRHRCWLHMSDLKATGVARFQWILPSWSQAITSDDAQPPEEAFALAAMITGLVSQRGLSLSPEVLRETYRRGLRSRGLLGTSGHRLRSQEAGNVYAAFLGPLPRMDQLGGLPTCRAAASAEIARLIGPIRSGIHPLRHIALASWLFGSTDAFLKHCEAAGHTAVTSEEKHPSAPPTTSAHAPDERKQQLIALLEAGVSVSRAARDVGVDTNTGMAWAASHGIATPRRPKVLTPEVRTTLLRLLKRGVSKDAAAEAAKVSVQTITNILRSEVGLHQAWKEAQFDRTQRHSRRRWLRYITANPHSGVKAARLTEPAVYAWLYRNDRDWLKNQNLAMERVARSPQARVDWDQRDRELSDQVGRVALELHEAEPDRRIRLFQIYQRLPELKAKLFKLDRLPLTKSVLYGVVGKKRGRDGGQMGNTQQV